jgi:probable rRNA maturation factor
MIILDPDLDPDPAPKPASTKRSGVSASKAKSKANPNEIQLPSARTLSRFLAAAQTAVRLKGQVTVLLTTDAAIRKLNRKFRGKNKATDVLSFTAEGLGAQGVAGDLAISVTTAMGQATEQGHSLSTEIKVLVLHGLLHLAGYDHEVDNGKMARRERLLRAKLKLPQGLIERAGLPKQVATRTAAKHPAGAKAHVSFRPFSARLKSCPVTELSGTPAEENVSSGAEAQESCEVANVRAKQAAEKLSFGRVRRYWHLQGLKPNIDLVGFIGPTEVVPFYKTFKIPAGASFSANCKARTLHSSEPERNTPAKARFLRASKAKRP